MSEEQQVTAKVCRERHGQHDSSRETGDCFRASMSVLLGVPNGDHLPHGIDTEGWWTDWWKFLLNLGLMIAHDNAQGPIWKEQPWIASVRSLNYEGATHAIVMHQTHEVLFDPSPLQRYEGSLLGADVVIGGTWLELADVERLPLLVAFRKQFSVGGSESRVAPGQLADEERSAPPTDLESDIGRGSDDA